MAKIDVAILSAMPAEAKIIKHQLSELTQVDIQGLSYQLGRFENKRIGLVATGIGKVNAAVTTARIIRDLDPDVIFFTGIAGRLAGDLAIGDIVLGESVLSSEIIAEKDQFFNTPITQSTVPEVFHANRRLLNLSVQPIEKLKMGGTVKILKGSIITSDSFPQPQALLEQVYKKHVNAIDMESVAVMQVCWLFKKPCLVVRGVSDDALATLDYYSIHGSFPLSDHVGIAINSAAQYTLELIKAL